MPKTNPRSVFGLSECLGVVHFAPLGKTAKKRVGQWTCVIFARNIAESIFCGESNGVHEIGVAATAAGE